MLEERKIKIARAFINLHKKDNPDHWLTVEEPLAFGDDKLLAVYDRLEAGAFGDIKCLDDQAGVYECEIEADRSKSGKHKFFTWEVN